VLLVRFETYGIVDISLTQIVTDGLHFSPNAHRADALHGTKSKAARYDRQCNKHTVLFPLAGASIHIEANATAC